MVEKMNEAAGREVFGTRTCRYTEELLNDLDWNGVDYRVHYVDEDAEALRRLARLVDGPCMVPILVEAGEVKQVGYRGRGCYVKVEPEAGALDRNGRRRT